MTTTTTHSRTFFLEREQLFLRNIEDLFEYFSDPLNLEAITPPRLHFHVLGCSTPAPLEGATIDYRLRVWGIPIRWRSVITDWRPPYGFVDRQVIGPYKLWIHHHTFVETTEGVLMKDHVEYAVPGGSLVHRLFVRRELKRVFDYRAETLAALLPDDPQYLASPGTVACQ